MIFKNGVSKNVMIKELNVKNEELFYIFKSFDFILPIHDVANIRLISVSIITTFIFYSGF